MNKTYLFILVLLTLFAFRSEGSIVYKDISPDYQTMLDPSIQSMSNLQKIDFDGDGSEEFNFRWEDMSMSGGDWFAYMTFSNSNEFILSGATPHASGSSYIEPLGKGANIGSGSNWGSSNPDPIISDNAMSNFQGKGDQYVGVKIKLSTGTHFGWILISFDNTKTLTVKEFAYETSTNTAINAGDKSSSSILVSSITVDGQGGSSTITTKGGTLQMEATVMPVDATDKSVTWSVTNGTGSATINTSGVLKAISDGTVTVTAKANDGSGVSGSKSITISNQSVLVTGITVQGKDGVSTIDMVGGSLQMEATVMPVDATDKSVTWSVTNGTGSATISMAGLVIGTSAGTVTITATANDGSGVSGSTSVTINGSSDIPVTSINVAGEGGVSSISTPGGTLQMEATVMPSNATDKSVTWSVTNGTGSATISSSGVLTATGDGMVMVIATANDGSGVSGSADVSISNQNSGIAGIQRSRLQVYPNPVHTKLQIANESGLTVREISIRSFEGKIIRNYVPKHTSGIDLSDLKAGTYYLSVLTDTGTSTYKVLKD